MEQKNKYGLKKEPIIIGKDYLLGGFTNVPKEVLQEDGQWLDFLPVVENQSTPTIESMACTVFTTLNCVEILIKRLYNK